MKTRHDTPSLCPGQPALYRPWYHCISRCSRAACAAFLYGHDHHSGQSLEHRRGWIAQCTKALAHWGAHVFAIDVAAYAVISHHDHVVLRMGRERAQGRSCEQVLQRWTRLLTWPWLVPRYLSPARAAMGEGELQKVHAPAEIYRARLLDLSWFMRLLNKSPARQAGSGLFGCPRVTGRNSRAIPVKPRGMQCKPLWQGGARRP